MTDQESDTSQLHALLIGIDCYLPNRLPDGSYYRNLSGCVRDISNVENFLLNKLQVQPQYILKLTSTDAGTGEPPEPREAWPTYENMVGAFGRLKEVAKPGDQIYIHYSGHGGRSPTLVPDIKGGDRYDESLVPADIGNPEARYLRDVEIANLLRAMVEKGLVVTLVLDSCHAGGATRGRGHDVNVRGIASIDTTPRRTESLVATHGELVATWRQMTETGTRNFTGGSGWLPDPRGYVLLAACRPSESAYEYAFDGRETNGALTYWLLNSLEDIGPGLTYKQLHDRIVAKVHSQFERQTPQLEGDGNRVVLGCDHVQSVHAALVMKVDSAQKKLLLNAGQTHGVREGAQFAIYSLLATDFRPHQRLALAKVNQVGATESWAQFTALTSTEIGQGAQALLINPASVKLVRKVRLLNEDDLQLMGEQATALIAVRDAIAVNAWVELAAKDESAQYLIAINTKGDFEILDRAGVPITNLSPALAIHDRNAAARVVQRLEHLTRYNSVQELDNYDPTSPLARKLLVEWAGFQRDYQRGEKPEPMPFETPDTPEVKVGEWIFLRVKNMSTSVLNVAVLDLQPDWGITQVHPSLPEWFAPLDPGQEQLIPLSADLPERYANGRDVLKVFATVGTANFHWLQMSPLDQPPTRNILMRGSSASPLDQLLAAMAADRPATRNLTPAAYPSQEWTTSQVEVQVRRSNNGQ